MWNVLPVLPGQSAVFAHNRRDHPAAPSLIFGARGHIASALGEVPMTVHNLCWFAEVGANAQERPERIRSVAPSGKFRSTFSLSVAVPIGPVKVMHPGRSVEMRRGTHRPAAPGNP